MATSTASAAAFLRRVRAFRTSSAFPPSILRLHSTETAGEPIPAPPAPTRRLAALRDRLASEDAPSPPSTSLPPSAPEWAQAAARRLASAARGTSAVPPPGVRRVLLHSCCAPCSGAMVEEMASNNAVDDVTVLFYNPNIHPRREYEIRKEENKKFCENLGIAYVDCDYDVENWYERTRGMEYDPERGRRCTECFDMRMERTALYAHENNFDAIATTNATSRWKDTEQVDDSGRRCAAPYPDLVYWAHDWKSDDMTLRKYQISASERFYKQEYCGCSHSLRDSNDWRRANGIPKIRIGGEHAGLGQRHFTDPIADATEESQDVVDEFFAHAEGLAAEAGTDRKERKRALRAYKDRRKNEKVDGKVSGLNNW